MALINMLIASLSMFYLGDAACRAGATCNQMSSSPSWVQKKSQASRAVLGDYDGQQQPAVTSKDNDLGGSDDYYSGPPKGTPPPPPPATPAPTPPPTYPTASPTALDAASPCARSMCMSYGDPHFHTFDGASTKFVAVGPVGWNFQGTGTAYTEEKPWAFWLKFWRNTITDFWLVHSESVQIQGQTSPNSVMAGVAFGGPWMKGHEVTMTMADTGNFVIRHKAPNIPGSVEILSNEGEYVIAGVGIIARGSGTKILKSDWEGDRWQDTGAKSVGGDKNKFDSYRHQKRIEFNQQLGDMLTRAEQRSNLFHFKLPENVDVLVFAPYAALTVTIKMPPQLNQGGYCGNFNSDAADDMVQSMPYVRRRRRNDIITYDATAAGTHLYHLEGSAETFFEAVDTNGLLQQDTMNSHKSRDSNTSDLCVGNQTLRKAAEEKCSHILEESFRESCLFDVCQTGDPEEGSNSYFAEAEELKEDAGDVMFVGYGRCLDGSGESFASVQANEVATANGCLGILKLLADKNGIFGAEFNEEGPSCGILVASAETVTNDVVIEGGWGASVAGAGAEIVANYTPQAKLTCWKLIPVA